MKKLLLMILSLALSVSVMALVTSCDTTPPDNEPCLEHTDLDGNGLCDDCKAEMPIIPTCEHKDSDYNELCDNCYQPYSVPVDFTLTLLDESGAAVSGISITLYKNNVSAFTATTDAQGKVSGTVNAGNYTVNAEGFPEFWYSDASYVNILVNATNKDFSYTAYDNTPTGSVDNPFHAEDANTGAGVSTDMPAGAEYYFTVKGISTRDLVINNASVKVTYDGNDYLPEGDTVRVRLNATSNVNEQIIFKVTNTSTEANTVVLSFEALPGSSDNPYAAELDTETVIEVVEDGSVHYKWTASASGILMVKSETAANNISMYNTTSYVVTGYTNGGRCEYLYVTVGDVVDITVALTDSAPTTEVVFTLSLCEGTEANPIPVYENASLRMPANATYYVVYRGEGANVIIPAEDLSVSLNGTAGEATGDSYILSVADGDVIVITNNGARVDLEIVVA